LVVLRFFCVFIYAQAGTMGVALQPPNKDGRLLDQIESL